MKLGELDLIEKCYNCNCAYFEQDKKNKMFTGDFLCNRCLKEKKEIKRQKEIDQIQREDFMYRG